MCNRYKEAVICTQDKSARIIARTLSCLLFLDNVLLIFYQAFGMYLPCTWCGMFVAEGMSICVSVRMNTVHCAVSHFTALYSGPSLSGHSQQRPPSLMWPQIFAAPTVLL